MKKIEIVTAIIVIFLTSCSNTAHDKKIGNLILLKQEDYIEKNLVIGSIFLKDKKLVFLSNDPESNLNLDTVKKIKNTINDINKNGYISFPMGGKELDENGGVVTWHGYRTIDIGNNQEFYNSLQSILSDHNVEIRD